ncbi:MAG: hypothetical protein ACRD06_02285 [Terriglobia bacterium]
MRRATILITALLAASLPFSTAMAQRTTGPQEPQNGRFGNPNNTAMNYQNYFYGVITKINPKALVLGKTKVGVPQTIELSKKTKYVRNGKRSSLGKLHVGDMVYIDLKTNKKTGVMLARKVVSGLDATVEP